MKTRLLKRLRREADNLYSFFPACKTYNNQMKMVWQVKRLFGMKEIVYVESEDELFALELYKDLKRDHILYELMCLKNKQLRNYKLCKFKKYG